GVNGFKIHEMTNRRIAISNPDSSQNISRFARTLHRHPNVVPFSERDLLRTDFARLHYSRETQREQLRFRNFLHHPHKLLLYELETGDGPTELFARFGISERRFVTIDRRPDHTPCHSD